ncbi:Stage V sporulation protein S [compost metagenome]
MEEEKITQINENGKIILKVSNSTNVASIAGAIAHAVKTSSVVEIHTIGAGALNQATKGIARARGYVAQSGRDLIVRPGFGTTNIDGEDRTTIIQVCTLL